MILECRSALWSEVAVNQSTPLLAHNVTPAAVPSLTGWQESLLAPGTAFAGSEFVTGSNIAGRVCPAHVFLNHADESTMKATGRCLYYDSVNAEQALDAAGTSGALAPSWLQTWDLSAIGRGSSASY